MKTYQFRIKDSSSARSLQKMAGSVNFCWNFCNETQKTALQRKSARILPDGTAIPNFLSAFEFSPLMKGVTKELGLHSDTVQAVAEEYVKKRKAAKKRWLRWRSKKKSLGWIPFKVKGIKVSGDTITYYGHTFRFWKSREIEGEIVTGSFCEDARGRWYVNLTVKNAPESPEAKPGQVGLDLGLKTLVTASTGKKYGAARYLRQYERKLKLAQKDNKKRRCKSIHAKIKNSRKDLAHKISHEITRDNNLIVIGDVSSPKLTKTRMAKSVLDAGWSQLKTFLHYKAITRKGVFVEVNEAFTSSTCSRCETRSPPGSPRGLKGLSIREWVCGHCFAVHDRDVNAALNILRLGHQALALK